MSLTVLTAVGVIVTQVIIIFGFLLIERRQPSATIAWLLAILLLPVVGVVLYIVFGSTRMRRITRRAVEIERRVTETLKSKGLLALPPALSVEHLAAAPQTDLDPRTEGLIRLGNSVSSTPASTGNSTKVLLNAAATYRSIILAIAAATDHIHVEFYIIQPDRSGRTLRDRLVARAKDGIKVRVVCDAVGSMALSDDFWEPLRAAGGQFAWFAPVNPLLRLRRADRIDFRNHRKIVVVDGTIGFTGGINVGREYLGLDPEVGHWRDTHLKIEGPAVLGLQHAFVEDWLAAADELLDERRYFPEPAQSVVGETDAPNAIVQIVDSGPDRSWEPIHRIHVQAIAFARRRVWITSPYFVPDAVVEEALVSAALRGVDVRLLLPSKSDSVLVGFASRAYYPTLLEAGVRIFEYARGFVHAKTLLVDHWVGTVGSANMDIRSFRLNFELNAFVFDDAFCTSLEQEFIDDLADAREISLEHVNRTPYWRRVAQGLAKLLSPLL